MISSLSQCLCSLLATPIKGNVRKTSISEKVEKTRLSQAYIETIKVTVASLPSVDFLTMQAQAGHLTLPNCLLLLTRSPHRMFLGIQGLSFMVLTYSSACVIIVSCMFDIVMLLKCFSKEIYVLVPWKAWFSVVFFLLPYIIPESRVIILSVIWSITWILITGTDSKCLYIVIQCNVFQ